MKDILKQTFQNNDDFAVCVKDETGKVLMQNSLCSDICGDYHEKICDIGCMKLYAKDESQQWQNWGSRIYNNTYVHGGYYDINLLCSNEHLITFLQPLKEKYEMALIYYKEKGLTNQEMKIISYVVKGASNPEICIKLSISKATLKTHMNNIYKKVQGSGDDPKFIPDKRLSSKR